MLLLLQMGGKQQTKRINQVTTQKAIELKLNFNQNTDRSGLMGIFSGATSEGYRLLALNKDAVAVADITYDVRGDQYRYAHREFGDQLATAGFDRHGY
jgi:hypothetical protein